MELSAAKLATDNKEQSPPFDCFLSFVSCLVIIEADTPTLAQQSAMEKPI